jgi:malto-oligosyltrehalose trehalohydrolase
MLDVVTTNSLAFGPCLISGGTRFHFWAPHEETIQLEIEGSPPEPMQATTGGWFVAEVEGAGCGTHYAFILPNGTRVPDPASRYQPDDVHGFSEFMRADDFDWQAKDWRGRPWEETVLYELHVGTFTQEGTFLAAIERLDHLVDLGVTAIQMMPIADFPGSRGWGYDGVLLYAPESSYGRPEDLKALIDAAHQRGIQMFLDVVYNHFGPEGNYLANYAPLFTEKHETPWGAAVNYDAAGSTVVREFVIQNAIYWMNEFRFDGLRFDAVHAILDNSQEHLLDEMAERIRSATRGRHIHLVVENEDNTAALLEREDHGPSLYTAQWNDDIHHALHVAATGETDAYYADYDNPRHKLGRALAEGFVFQGETMPYSGRARGEPSAGLPPTAFVAFIQNHDQVGNRAFGDRITSTAPTAAMRAIAAIYLLSPQIPMIFMGEEWASTQPFPYFCDFDGELGEAIRKGRRKELAKLPGFADNDSADEAPDPTALSTFQSAKLRWDIASTPSQAEWTELYRSLLRLRNAEIVPRLHGIGAHSGHYSIEGHVVHVHWKMGDGSRLSLVTNLGPDTETILPRPPGTLLWREGDLSATTIGPWAVRWSLAPSDSEEDAR